MYLHSAVTYSTSTQDVPLHVVKWPKYGGNVVVNNEPYINIVVLWRYKQM